MSTIFLSPDSSYRLDRPWPLESGDVLYCQNATFFCGSHVEAFHPKNCENVTIVGPLKIVGANHQADHLYSLVNIDSCKDIHLEKITAICGETGIDGHCYAGQLFKTSQAVLLDCDWSGSRRSVGFNCDFCEDIHFERNRFHNNWLDGIKLTRHNKRIYFNGGFANENGKYGSPRGAGIHASAHGVSISNLSASHNNGDGIIIKSTKNLETYGPRTGISIRGCNFLFNRDYGVQSAVTNYYDETPFQIAISIDGCNAEENGVAGFCALGGTMNVSNSLARLNKRFGVHFQTQAENCGLCGVWLVANKQANLSDQGKDLCTEMVMSYAKDVINMPKGDWDSAEKLCELSIKSRDILNDRKYRGVNSIGF